MNIHQRIPQLYTRASYQWAMGDTTESVLVHYVHFTHSFTCLKTEVSLLLFFVLKGTQSTGHTQINTNVLPAA